MQYKFLIYISYSYAIPIGNPLEKEIKNRGYEVQWFSDLEEGSNGLINRANVLSGIKDVIHYNPDIVLAVYSNYGINNIFITTDATSNTPTWSGSETAPIVLPGASSALLSETRRCLSAAPLRAPLTP